MTLKEMLTGRNYEIFYKGRGASCVREDPWATTYTRDKVWVQDMDNNKTIIEVRNLSKFEIYTNGTKQKIDQSIAEHMFKELTYMYYTQEQEKERKKAEEAAARFEQKKNAVYQQLFDTIYPRNK